MGDNSLKGTKYDCNNSSNLCVRSCLRTSPAEGVETSYVGASHNAGGGVRCEVGTRCQKQTVPRQQQ